MLNEENGKGDEHESINREAAQRNILRSGSVAQLRDWAIRTDVRIGNMKDDVRKLKEGIWGNGKQGLKSEFLAHETAQKASIKTALIILGSLGSLNLLAQLITIFGK